jgi:hypothetical protein
MNTQTVSGETRDQRFQACPLTDCRYSGSGKGGHLILPFLIEMARPDQSAHGRLSSFKDTDFCQLLVTPIFFKSPRDFPQLFWPSLSRKERRSATNQMESLEVPSSILDFRFRKKLVGIRIEKTSPAPTNTPLPSRAAVYVRMSTEYIVIAPYAMEWMSRKRRAGNK